MGAKLDAMNELHESLNAMSDGDLREAVFNLNAESSIQIDEDLYDYHFARYRLASSLLYAREMEDEIQALRERQEEFLADAMAAVNQFYVPGMDS